MALATPALGGATARDVVAARLTQGDRDVAGWVMLGMLLFTLGFTLLVLFTLLFEVTSEAWPMISERPVAFITDTIGSDPAESGLWPGIFGTFFIGLGVVASAFPVGIGAAIYLEEYARDGFLTRLIMVSMRNLAGVPAVIYGVLGLHHLPQLARVRDRRQQRHLGRVHDGDPRDADRDHHLDGGDPCGTAGTSRRGVWRRRLALGGHPRPHAPVCGARHPDRHDALARHERSARRRRC